MSASQLRLCVTAPDDETLCSYRDMLGFGVEGTFTSEDGGRVTILQAGRATLELADPAYAAHIDAGEVGRRVARHVRVALEVDDAAGAGRRLPAPAPPVPFPGASAATPGQVTLHSCYPPTIINRS